MSDWVIWMIVFGWGALLGLAAAWVRARPLREETLLQSPSDSADPSSPIGRRWLPAVLTLLPVAILTLAWAASVDVVSWESLLGGAALLAAITMVAEWGVCR